MRRRTLLQVAGDWLADVFGVVCVFGTLLGVVFVAVKVLRWMWEW